MFTVDNDVVAFGVDKFEDRSTVTIMISVVPLNQLTVVFDINVNLAQGGTFCDEFGGLIEVDLVGIWENWRRDGVDHTEKKQNSEQTQNHMVRHLLDDRIQVQYLNFSTIFNYFHQRQMASKRPDKKNQPDKNANYKTLIANYYDRDVNLGDVKSEICSITPDIEILDELNQFEQKIDTLIKTKRYDVQELYMKPPQKLKRLLRVKAIKSVQGAQNIIKLYGYIYPKKQETSNIKFTSFFRQIQFTYQNQKILLQTWKKPVSNFAEKDGILIKLPRNDEQVIGIEMTLISNPPKFSVDPMLQKIVGIKVGTRVEVLQAFWLYVKTKKLQDTQNKEIINSDQLLRQAFKAQKLTFATVNNRVRQLLIPVDPIRFTLQSEETSRTFDIIVQVEEKPNIDIVPFFAQKLNQEKNEHPFLSLTSKIKKYDNKFREHSEKLRRHLVKRQIYMNFKPQKIEEIIKEQQKLLKILKSSQPFDEQNRLQYILQNEDQVQKEIKHYFEHMNSMSNSELK